MQLISAHTWLAWTNVVALAPILLSWSFSRHDGAWIQIFGVVMCGAAISSVLMHLSETKHDLDPGHQTWHAWSSFFLNLDRVFAYATAIGGFMLWFECGCPRDLVALVVVGLVCNILGEQTRNIPIYVALHTVWHVCAYADLFLVLLQLRKQ